MMWVSCLPSVLFGRLCKLSAPKGLNSLGNHHQVTGVIAGLGFRVRVAKSDKTEALNPNPTP